MKAEEKLQKAKVQLILNQPFFATLALGFQYMPTDAVPTAAINGRELKYNPAYIDTLTIDQLQGLLAHEVMHVGLLHHIRRNHRDSLAWNKAVDYAVNPIIIAAGFELPDGYLFNEQFKDHSAEKIYDLLPARQSGDNQHAADDEPGMGEVEDLPPDQGKQQAEDDAKQALAQAMMIAKRQGKLPAGLEKLVQEVLAPAVDWRTVLSRFLSELAKNDYTWLKPSARHLHAHLYLPSLESKEIGSIVLIVDTSGSINDAILSQFASEVQDITSWFNIGVTVIYVDTKVQHVQDIQPNEAFRLEAKGGGGTDFRPGFAYLEEQDTTPTALIYLTDGCCNTFPQAPDYPVLWVQFANYDFTPPFGELIKMTV